jgi:hypothetical protein
MEILINNNPHFTNFLGDRLINRHRIETTTLINPDTFHSILIIRHKRDDEFVRNMYHHLMKFNKEGSRDRSGFKVLVETFRRQKYARLS